MEKSLNPKLVEDCNTLLTYLKAHTDRWVSKEELCDQLPDVFIKSPNKNSHDICSYIWTCKDTINNYYDLFEDCKLIITNSNGDLKIPTKEEADAYIIKEMRNNKLRLWRSYNKVKQLRQDGTLTLDGYLRETLAKDDDLSSNGNN